MAVSSFAREYGGVVWTDHALERLRGRGVNQSDALAVMRNPEKTYPGKKEDSVKFIRTINGRRMHVVAVMNDQKKWVVVSAWVRGEEDQYGFPEKYVYKLVDWVAGKLVRLVRGK